MPIAEARRFPFPAVSSLVLAVSLLINLHGVPASAEDSATILWLGGTEIVPQPSLGRFGDSDERVHGLLIYRDILTAENRETLESMSVRLLDYMPENAFFVSFQASHATLLKSLPFLHSLLPIPAERKMHPGILAGGYPFWAKISDKTVAANVLFFDDVPLESATLQLSTLGVTWEDSYAFGHSHLLKVILDPAETGKLAVLDSVSWIESIPAPPRAVNTTAASRSKINTVQAAPYSLSGNGVNLVQFDGGRVGTHADLTGHVTVKTTDSTNDHATHTAGTMVGSGAGDARAKGMAPGAMLYNYSYYGNVLNNNYTAANTYSCIASNNSWGPAVGWEYNGSGWDWYGSTDFGAYTSNTRAYDKLVQDTGMLFNVSAGNDRGDTGDGSRPPDGPYDSIGPMATGKDTLTIGATNDNDTMSDFSSWGPCNDGRIKPDVVTNGVNLFSTIPNNRYASYSGTSMSCPVATGACALVVQQYKQLFSGQEPGSQLVKGLLIEGAVDKGNRGSDYVYGHGLLNIKNSVDLLREHSNLSAGWNRFLNGSVVSAGQVREYRMQVPANATLRVTLYWQEREGAASASKAIINDLDLQLINPTGVGSYPWVMNPSSPQTAAIAGVNTRDNVEVIDVPNAQSGLWTIRVTATSLPAIPQGFVLLASHAFTDQSSVPTFTPTATTPPSNTPTPSKTPTRTSTRTPTPSLTPTRSPTRTLSPVPTTPGQPTFTPTPSSTTTPTPSQTPTMSPTSIGPRTATPTPTGGIPTRTILRWRGGDPDLGENVYFTVYLEPNNPHPAIPLTTSLVREYIDPGSLQPLTNYYWQVVARDAAGYTTAGDVWNFRTGELPGPSFTPTPTATQTPPPPPGTQMFIRAAGYLDTNLTQGGGTLTLFAYAQDPLGRAASRVQLYYEGIPTGLSLVPTSAGSPVFQYTAQLSGPLPMSRSRIELVAQGAGATESTLWPYLTVTSNAHSAAQPDALVEEPQPQATDDGEAPAVNGLESQEPSKVKSFDILSSARNYVAKWIPMMDSGEPEIQPDFTPQSPHPLADKDPATHLAKVPGQAFAWEKKLSYPETPLVMQYSTKAYGDSPPNKPSNPDPADGTTNVYPNP